MFSPIYTANFAAISDRVSKLLACVASVSVWFRSKKRPRNDPRNKILGFGRARNETSAPLFCLRHFDSRPPFLAPKPHGNACYAGSLTTSGDFMTICRSEIANITNLLGFSYYLSTCTRDIPRGIPWPFPIRHALWYHCIKPFPQKK